MLGILLIDKPLGVTSHDVVNTIRRRFCTRRVGHAGTLDPLATGLLVVAIGPATRFLQYLPLEPKEYIAEIKFGEASSTYDAEGEVTFSGLLPENLTDAIATNLPTFRGLIQQLPPMYSAVKKNGQPLYRLARQGVEVEREPRTVHISAFDVLSIEANVAKVRVVCSGGTYIRSLAHDLGMSLGCGAMLSSLVRTGVGRFNLDMAQQLDRIELEKLIPLSEALPPMPMFALDLENMLHVRDGRAIQGELPDHPDAKLVGLLDANGYVLGVARVEGSLLHPECVLPKEAAIGI